MDHVRKDGSTLLKDFRCRTIIFINNLSMKDERLQQRPIEFARKRELFLAARGMLLLPALFSSPSFSTYDYLIVLLPDHGINTMIFGSEEQFDLGAELVPANTKPKIVYFKKRAAFLRSMGKLLMPGIMAGELEGIERYRKSYQLFFG